MIFDHGVQLIVPTIPSAEQWQYLSFIIEIFEFLEYNLYLNSTI